MYILKNVLLFISLSSKVRSKLKLQKRIIQKVKLFVLPPHCRLKAPFVKQSLSSYVFALSRAHPWMQRGAVEQELHGAQRGALRRTDELSLGTSRLCWLAHPHALLMTPLALFSPQCTVFKKKTLYFLSLFPHGNLTGSSYKLSCALVKVDLLTDPGSCWGQNRSRLLCCLLRTGRISCCVCHCVYPHRSYVDILCLCSVWDKTSWWVML